LCFRDFPQLGETCVNADVVGAAKIITLARLPWVSKAESRDGPRSRPEHVRISTAIR
jgi:hypothetical protein